MNRTKTALVMVVSVSAGIYKLYLLYKDHESEIAKIMDPIVKAFRDVKDVNFSIIQRD